MGFSLLEVLICIVILAFAAVLLLVFSRTAATGNDRSKIYGEAYSALKEVYEEVRLLPMDSLRRIHDAHFRHAHEKVIEVRVTARRIRAGDVADISLLDTASLRHVTFRATFKGESGNPVAKSFTTILYTP